MKQNTRIPTLLFLHSRSESSEAEEMELAAWRLESEENEQLFRQISDPEYVRAKMTDLYKTREQVFDKLKSRFSYLSDSKLSNQVGYDPGSDYDSDEEEELRDFPEKHILESGLSKADFWAARLEEMQIDAEDESIDESRVEEPAELYRTKKSDVRRPHRYLRISMRVAAAVLIMLGIL